MNVGGRLPATASRMIGSSSGFDLLTIGGSMPRGRRFIACEILLWTSCIATSMSRSSSSSIVMPAEPWREVEVTSFTPSTEVTVSSRMSTTSVSMISGDAPSQVMETLTTGKSTSGFWLIPSPRNTVPKPVKVKSPKPISANIRIQANTWLRIEMSASVMLVAILSGSSFASGARGLSSLIAPPSEPRPRPPRPPCRPRACRSPPTPRLRPSRAPTGSRPLRCPCAGPGPPAAGGRSSP